jgi:hypothetical protein
MDFGKGPSHLALAVRSGIGHEREAREFGKLFIVKVHLMSGCLICDGGLGGLALIYAFKDGVSG